MKDTRGNVSYTLLERRKIADYIDSLQGKKMGFNDFESAIKKLISMGDQVIPVCISKLKIADEDLLHKLSYILEVLGDEDIINPLLQLVKDQELSDNHKAVILNILCGLGVDPVDLPMEEIFEDFDQVAENAVNKILEDIEVSRNIPSFLDEFSSYPSDVKEMLIEEFIAEASDSVTFVLGYIARTYDFEVVTAAIHALGKIATPKAAGILSDLAKIPEIKVSALATKELQKLKMLGIKPKTIKSHLRKSQGEIFKVLISSIDGRGSRVIWFIWRFNNRKTMLSSVNFLVNTNVGIKDCWGFEKTTDAELYKLLRKMGDGISFLEGDFEYALELLRDALHINFDKGYPVPMEYGYWSTSFDDQLLYPKPFVPNLVDLDMYEILNNEQFYEDSNLLHETREFRDWFVAEPSVYDFAEQYLEIENKFKHKDTYKLQLDNIREKFIKKFLVPQKETLKANLERTVDFLLRMKEKEKASIAMSTLLNMDIKPYTRQPFINRIFWESINIAINNMKNGFDMRKNPEAFD